LILNLVIVFAVIIGIILLVVWMIRRLGNSGSASTSLQASSEQSVTPSDILQMRYAQGEITRKEYQQMLSDLK